MHAFLYEDLSMHSAIRMRSLPYEDGLVDCRRSPSSAVSVHWIVACVRGAYTGLWRGVA